LNALATGEEWAASRGVNVDRLKKIAYFAASILTAAVTAFAGPIGFVGLIVPHTLRLVVGPDHRLLIPASFFVGGAFLVVCDTFARTILSPTEMPVGIVTALLGGPFFIFLLKRRQTGLW
jgi:iron complex transport system permease protein